MTFLVEWCLACTFPDELRRYSTLSVSLAGASVYSRDEPSVDSVEPSPLPATSSASD